jgi:RNA recognition motif-containing protein
MGRRLYVGNLPYKATDEDLTTLFGSAGGVTSARVMRDMSTGRARGFGFVEMATDEAAEKAIEKFNEYDMDGRKLVVNEAKPKTEGGGRGFGGGGGGGLGRGNRGGGDDFGGGGPGGRREPRW